MPQELRYVKCHFGDAEVEAFKITPMSIKCNVPQLPPGEYGLSISINGIHYTRQQTPFFISPAIRLNTLDPNSGPVNGGTIVSIDGTGFLMHQTVYCRFGNSIVVGFVRSSEKIQCKTPPQASIGEVYVEISVGDNVAFFASSLKYEYLENVIVFSIAPSFGPTNGSTAVVVSGSGFADKSTLSCRFGSVDPVISAGTYINPNKISCISPPSEVAPLNVEISVNGVDFSDSGQRFEYVAPVRVQSFHPRSGPYRGGTNVVIEGKNFIASPYLRCRFGEMDVVAEYLNANSISCVTPSTTVGVAKIGISNNGVDFEYSGSTFTFGNLPSIDSLGRRNVSVYGSNRIYLRGPNFLNDTINCRIEVPYLYYTKEYIVKGEYFNTTTISCSIPSIEMESSKTLMSALISSSTNGQQFGSAVPLVFVSRPEIYNVMPKSIQPGQFSVLNISGSDFVDTLDTHCRIVELDIRYKAMFVSEKNIQCGIFIPLSLDAQKYKTLALKVGNVNDDVSLAQINLTVLSTPKIHSIFPTIGSEEGGTAIRIRGTGFSQSSYTCRFGGSYTVNAVKRDENNIICLSPPNPPAVNVSLAIESESQVIEKMDGQRLYFSYHGKIRVSRILTLSGSTQGGNTVKFVCDGLDTSMDFRCKFGTVISMGKYVSNTTFECVSLPNDAGEVNVYFAVNGQDFIYSGFNYTFFAPAHIERLDPAFGPIAGGIYIQVVGSGFRETESIVCKFGHNETVVAFFKTTQRIMCLVPPSSVPGVTTVEVSMDGKTYTRNLRQFVYIETPHIVSVNP